MSMVSATKVCLEIYPSGYHGNGQCVAAMKARNREEAFFGEVWLQLVIIAIFGVALNFT